MRIRHGCLLVVMVLLTGCGNSHPVGQHSSAVGPGAGSRELALPRVACTTVAAGGPFLAAAEDDAAGNRTLYRPGNLARAVRVASRHLARWAVVTSIRLDPTELEVTAVSARGVRSFRVGDDDAYSLQRSGPWTGQAYGFYLSQIRPDDLSILLRGLAQTAAVQPAQVEYVLAQEASGIANVQWTAFTASGSVQVANGQVENSMCGANISPGHIPSLTVPTNPPPAGSPLATEGHDDPALMRANDPRSMFRGGHFARMLSVVRHRLGSHVWIRSLDLDPGSAMLLIVSHGWETAVNVDYDGHLTIDTAAASHTGPLPGFYLSRIDPNGVSVLTQRIATEAHVPISAMYSLVIAPNPFTWRLTSTRLRSFLASSPTAPILETGSGATRVLVH